MKTEIQRKLKAIIEQHGHDVINDHRRVKALLTDHFPHNKREVRVLMMALVEGIVPALFREGQTVSSIVLVNKFSQQLHDELGVDLTLARWAVETWAMALSLQAPQTTQKLARVPTSTVPTPKPTAPSNKVLIGDRYIDNQDGTVTDIQTDLQWQRCAVGQIWNGSTCIGEATRYTWEEAIKLTSYFAGKSDWRLPNIQELNTLVYCSNGKQRKLKKNGYGTVDHEGYFCCGSYTRGEFQRPTINMNAFPATPSDLFWSSSSFAGDANYAWYVYLYSGSVNWYDKSAVLAVRLVRSQ